MKNYSAKPFQRLLIGLSVLALAHSSFAQEEGKKDKGPILDVKLGYTHDYKARSTETYYKVSLFGKQFASLGEEPEFADVASGGLADVTTRPFFLSIDRGYSEIGGSLLEGYSTTELKRFIKGLQDFKLVLGVDVQLEKLQNTAYTYGVEYKPIAPLSFIRQSTGTGKGIPAIPSYLILGIVGQKLVEDDGTTQDQSSATLRAWAGRTWFFQDDDKEKIKRLTEQLKQYKANYDGYDEMVEVRKSVKAAKDKNSADPYAQFGPEAELVEALLVKFTDVENQGEWDRELSYPFKDVGPPPNPNLAVWFDANARYAITTDHIGDRFRSIYSLNAKYYFNPSSPDTLYLQAQYINGFLETDLVNRANRFVVTLGFKF